MREVSEHLAGIYQMAYDSARDNFQSQPLPKFRGGGAHGRSPDAQRQPVELVEEHRGSGPVEAFGGFGGDDPGARGGLIARRLRSGGPLPVPPRGHAELSGDAFQEPVPLLRLRARWLGGGLDRFDAWCVGTRGVRGVAGCNGIYPSQPGHAAGAGGIGLLRRSDLERWPDSLGGNGLLRLAFAGVGVWSGLLDPSRPVGSGLGVAVPPGPRRPDVGSVAGPLAVWRAASQEVGVVGRGP